VIVKGDRDVAAGDDGMAWDFLPQLPSPRGQGCVAGMAGLETRQLLLRASLGEVRGPAEARYGDLFVCSSSIVDLLSPPAGAAGADARISPAGACARGSSLARAAPWARYEDDA